MQKKDRRRSLKSGLRFGVDDSEWAGSQFRKGRESFIPLMFVGGRTAGVGIVLAMLYAAFTFK